ncbi:MAG: T9SS type A sorting domain-containing protein, partial [Bacteroidales bacterium]|nr:T9SS type A sorting domain-containing protein [Bacteroidales bacterium]
QAFVTNLLGQQVLSVQGEGDELQIDMTALPAGVYFVTVTDENGRKCVRKAVRE